MYSPLELMEKREGLLGPRGSTIMIAEFTAIHGQAATIRCLFDLEMS